MKQKILSYGIALCATGVAQAIELPEIIGNDMVLQQQQKNAKLWGWAKPGNYVTITTGWNKECYHVKTDDSGRWELGIATPTASFDKHELTFREFTSTPKKGSKPIDEKKVEGVLIGEVWFCSGQSNMEMPLGGFWNCPVEGANETILKSQQYRNAIRVATIEHQGTETPQTRVKGKWEVAEPKCASRFSACAYFFATTLTDALQVPVGVINCSWGGSCVEGWLPKDTLLTYHDGLTPITLTDYHRKMVMFNGMLAPLAGYTIKGFLWNQGESNVGRTEEYVQRFSTMTRLWRKLWNQPGDHLPIYTVELPPYRYGIATETAGAEFRATQHRIARELEYCGCVCTSDLMYEHEIDQIHGCKKKEIGERLAWLALTRDYGMEGLAAEAPEFEYMEWVEASEGDKAVIAGSTVDTNPAATGKVLRLYFSNSKDGFDRMSGIQGFEAQDADGNWHPAIVWSSSAWQNVKRQGCFLALVCPGVADIKNVRYCYRNFVIGQLHNLRGLPVVPFTTEK